MTYNEASRLARKLEKAARLPEGVVDVDEVHQAVWCHGYLKFDQVIEVAKVLILEQEAADGDIENERPVVVD